MLNCKQVSELSSRSLDSRLRWRQRMQMKLHLMMCEACKQYLKQLQFIQKSAKSMDIHFQNITLPDEARLRILAKISDLQK